MKHVLFFLLSFSTFTLVASDISYSLQCARNAGSILGFLTTQIWNTAKCCTRPAAERFKIVHVKVYTDRNLLEEKTQEFHETRTAQCTGFCTLGCCAFAAGQCAACCCGASASIPFYIVGAASCARAGKTTCYCPEN